MPTTAIGAIYNVYIPNVDALITLGYTHVRIYWATSENGSYSLSTSVALVTGTYGYEYNNTAGAAGDWAKHAYYGAVPGETVTSEPVPVAPGQSTRALIRQGAGRRVRLMEPLHTITTVTDTDTIVVSSLIDADGRAETLSNRFGRSGTQSRRIRNAAGSGYVPSTGTLNFRRAFSPTLAEGDTLEIWKSRADEDPSVMMDEAMQRARKFIWWEETLYLTATAEQTEYYLPGIIVNKRQVKRVEWALDNFPARPVWQPASKDVTFDGGIALLSVSKSAGITFDAGTTIRVLINRFGDRMDSESDYWLAPLEWCIAETAREFLEVAGAPTGSKEDVTDFNKTLRDVQAECFDYRAVYLPEIELSMEAPAL